MIFSRKQRWLRGILWMCVLFMALLLCAPPRASQDECHGLSATPSLSANQGMLVASFLKNTLGNRTRIIQVTTVAVIVGIFILQWRRT